MEHLALEVFDLKTKDNPNPTGSKYAVLSEDESITITDTSEIFASGDVWSYSFKLNVFANAHIFGTAGDIHGGRLHEQINKRRVRLWVEGLPLYLGYLKLSDEAEVDENGDVDVTFESGQKTFDEMIEGAKANQVPFTEDILIGMALWQKREVDMSINVRLTATIKDGAQFDITGRVTDGTTIVLPGYYGESVDVSSKDIGICTSYPRMVFPKGVFKVQGGSTPSGGVQVNHLNTDFPYDDAHPYCNIAICYQKHGFPTVNGKVDYSADEQTLRGYEIAPANRVNSAPNFFVLYWLKCLMKHLGISIEENQMANVEDLRRLFFVNTNCAYEVPTEFDRTGANRSARYGCFATYHYDDYIAERFENTVDLANSKLDVKSWDWKIWSTSTKTYVPIDPGAWYYAVKMQADIVGARITDMDDYAAKNRRYHYAYATNECFPNADISEVIKALEDGFGVRFLFSDNYQRVRIVLLRNIFRNTDIQEITCDIAGEDVKVENAIRGFRMTYGDKKDDTTFYYKGFADKLAKTNELWTDDSDTHDYSHWNLNADYETLIRQISAFDKTCYVTANNGDAYGIKIDKDAKAYEELHPSLFEYAGYMDAEDGDCTGDAETIETINVGFSPAIVNDVNFEQERSDDNNTNQQFALFISEDMRSRRPDLEDKTPPESYNDSDAVYDVNKIPEEKKKLGLFAINSDMPVRRPITCEKRNVSLVHDHQSYVIPRLQAEALIEGYINEGCRLYLQDNYEPNSDGVSPLEKKDWGLTLGIMRGSGSDAYVNYSADPDDNEDNDTWDIVPGSNVTAHPDTCDNYGRIWDYDGRTGYNAVCTTPAEAKDAMSSLWGDSHFDLTSRSASSYLTGYVLPEVTDNTGKTHKILLAGATSDQGVLMQRDFRLDYIHYLQGKSIENMLELDEEIGGYIIEIDSSQERAQTLLALQKLAYANGGPVTISGGADVREGRFSLKLRAEKPNPYFDASQPESNSNRRYLEITNKNLQGRGLCDQFYKEYSYFIRHARIVKRPVHMTIAQLLAIDKTVRVTVGDITGFIKKIQYGVSNKTGLGIVTMEIMYI